MSARSQKKYYQSHRDKRLSYQKEYVKNNRERINAYCKEYYNRVVKKRLVYCDACRYNYTIRQYELHTRTKKHEKNLNDGYKKTRAKKKKTVYIANHSETKSLLHEICDRTELREKKLLAESTRRLEKIESFTTEKTVKKQKRSEKRKKLRQDMLSKLKKGAQTY